MVRVSSVLLRPFLARALALGALACAAAAMPARAETPSAPLSVADVLGAMVAVRAEVPAHARSASSLGTQRAGNGVIITDDGLVLTIGYLILEAERAEVVVPGGPSVPATVVGYDYESGFGLVRANNRLEAKPMRLGDSGALAEGTPVLAVSVGAQPVTPAYVLARRPFAGGWEYLLEDAILTSPPHPQFGGAALVTADGRLVGIGSLFINVADRGERPVPGNMFVPIDRLKPILADMIETGRPSGPRRPWLGVNTDETTGRVVIARVTAEGPADRAGLKTGDVIMGVGGHRVEDTADFLRKVWTRGDSGAVIPLDVLRLADGKMDIQRFEVTSISRYDWLRLGRSP